MKTIRTGAVPQGARWSMAGRFVLVAAAVVLGSLALPAAAAVYKWVDPQGRIHYSDLPPPPDGKLLSVDASARSPAYERPGASNGRPSLPAAAAPTGPVSGPAASPEAVARLKQAVDSDVSNAQADDCKKAQDRYQNYVHSRRLYKEGPDHERIYLSDQELETERLQAKHEVDETCGAGH